MIFFTHTITPRIKFVTGLIAEVLGVGSIDLTTDKSEFKESKSPKINYSSETITENELLIHPHSLLFESGIKQHEIKISKRDDQAYFFIDKGELGFDIFAAIFYLVSRYEEYLPHEKDQYGRYDHQNSLAFREGFLDRPIVNEWVNELARVLERKFPGKIFKKPVFNFHPSYDIDEAYSYLSKDWIRTVGATLKNVVTGKFSIIKDRFRVIREKSNDPFDSFDWMDKVHKEYGLKPIYFFLVPAKIGRYDRNILPTELRLQQLIRRISENYEIGIHPSWQSGDTQALLKEEIKTLQDLSGKKIQNSRQHFIRMDLPDTYRHLVELGIKADYSMGYGSINGFRASIASPFSWYDLEKESITDLKIHPFCFMEANSFYELKHSPEEALNEMRMYYMRVRNSGGTLMMIWHNTFLGTDQAFKGWRDIYLKFITEINTPL